MKKTDVLIIGGSAAGMVCSLAGKAHWPDKEFTMIKMQTDVMVPCGIPYIFGTFENTNNNIMPVDAMMQKNGINSINGEVISIDVKGKTVTFKDNTQMQYGKLVIATGSTPVKPRWLQGTHLENVFVIPKEKNYLDEMLPKLVKVKEIAIIGGGFIGIELSDELAKRGYSVTLIEKEKDILSSAFDKEFSDKVHEIMEDRSIKVITGVGIKSIVGIETVEAVELENGKLIKMDAVILSMGYRPNTILAKNSGIYTDEDEFIAVDEYMRTHAPDVFAIGDCAQKRDFITRKRVATMLASTACAEARIAGMNLFNLHVVKTFSGTIAIYSTALGDTGFGTAGLTEERARQEGISTITGIFEGINRHPGSMPGVHKQTVKLIAAEYSGVIIGGEVMGGMETGELTNVIGLAIQNKMSVNSLLIMQIGTHPCLTASPAAYPLIKAAEIISGKMLTVRDLVG